MHLVENFLLSYKILIGKDSARKNKITTLFVALIQIWRVGFVFLEEGMRIDNLF